MHNTGRILFLIIFITGVLGAVITGAPMYSRLAILSVLIVSVSWAWTRSALHGIKVTRAARSLKASVGDILEENFEIANSSRIPKFWVEVVNQTNLPAPSGSRVLIFLSGRQRRFYLARTWITRRGAFKLGPTVLSSGDPFGLFRTSRTFPAADSMIVLPLIVQLASFPVLPGLLPGGKAIRQKSQGVTAHAAGVREYVTGDPLKSIHWASTARRQKLMVKEFEQDPQTEFWLFLDTQQGSHFELPYEETEAWLDGALFSRKPQLRLPPSTLEYGVTIAASLAHYLISGRNAVGYVSPGQVLTVIPAERSERQEGKILETLAFVRDDATLSLAGAVAAQARFLPLGSSAVLITPTTRPDVLLAVDELQRRNLRPLVILLMAETFGGRQGAEKLAENLLERRVPVCQVSCGDDIAVVLDGFAAKYAAKDVRDWQKFGS